MRRWTYLAGMLLILPTAGLAQSSSTDSEALQALLAEMRQLRQELRTATINAQRAQILIYRVQSQQAVVNRLTQRVDTERSRLTQIQSEEKRFASSLKHVEDSQEDSQSSKSEAERKQAADQIAQMKNRLEQLGGEEQDAVTRKMQAEEELRLEQSKLSQLQDALDRIDKELEQASHPRN